MTHLQVLVNIGMVRIEESEDLHNAGSSEGLHLPASVVVQEGHEQAAGQLVQSGGICVSELVAL